VRLDVGITALGSVNDLFPDARGLFSASQLWPPVHIAKAAIRTAWFETEPPFQRSTMNGGFWRERLFAGRRASAAASDPADSELSDSSEAMPKLPWLLPWRITMPSRLSYTFSIRQGLSDSRANMETVRCGAHVDCRDFAHDAASTNMCFPTWRGTRLLLNRGMAGMGHDAVYRVRVA
jgi:hypothetical protein